MYTTVDLFAFSRNTIVNWRAIRLARITEDTGSSGMRRRICTRLMVRLQSLRVFIYTTYSRNTYQLAHATQYIDLRTLPDTGSSAHKTKKLRKMYTILNRMKYALQSSESGLYATHLNILHVSEHDEMHCVIISCVLHCWLIAWMFVQEVVPDCISRILW